MRIRYGYGADPVPVRELYFDHGVFGQNNNNGDHRIRCMAQRGGCRQ